MLSIGLVTRIVTLGDKKCTYNPFFPISKKENLSMSETQNSSCDINITWTRHTLKWCFEPMKVDQIYFTSITYS